MESLLKNVEIIFDKHNINLFPIKSESLLLYLRFNVTLLYAV